MEENQPPYTTPERRAIHEAGHVVLHRCFGDPAKIESADIKRSEERDAYGQVVVPTCSPSALEAVSLMVSTLGGLAAEHIQYCDRDYRGGDGDIREAEGIYHQLVDAMGIEPTKESTVKCLNACTAAAIMVLKKRWSCVEKVASALLLKEEIFRPEIIELTVDCHPREFERHIQNLYNILMS